VNESEVFIKAERALKAVVDQIRDDQWDMVMPPDFATSGVEGPITLREVINYHAYDDAWVPDMLAGRTMDEVGKEAFKGDLLGDNPKASFAAIVEKATAAADALGDKNLGRTVHCSFGDFPAREYLWQITSFRGLRAHDIAKVIGADTRLPADLVQGLWDQLAPIAEEWRKIGVFGPKVDVPDSAPLQDRLLALTGRQP
jgi:uncharacterized protein (TIGR03086 family)